MNSQLTQIAAQQHIDELRQAAERARRAQADGEAPRARRRYRRRARAVLVTGTRSARAFLTAER
jgi:hypothetical protein